MGFFGGSFDPIHFGHISLAVHLLEKYNLQEILFCPAAVSPFKTDRPPAVAGKHRFEMLKLALDLPQFKISTLELDRRGTSFTIDTIRALGSEDEFHLLLSDEAAKDLDRWKEAEALKKIAPPLVGERVREISSTDIRARLQNKLYCAHLVPLKALDYIQANQLYSS